MFHRREIDGLRAFAILPVLFYHAGFSWIPGGFFGVDVFFVISGFLITMILLNELGNTGRISITGFYERRARRILPALFLVIFVSVVAGWFLLFTEEFKTFIKSIISILYFGSNYFFLGETGYFAADIDLNPMVHTWSLAIEEQFYLFFPLLLWLLWKFVGRKFLVAVLVVIGVASLVAAITFQGDPSNTFYLLQYRSWELIAGSLAAVALSKRDYKPISNQWLSLIGFVAILVSVFFLDNKLQHPGLITLVPIIGTCLVIMFAGDKTWVQSLLNLKVFVGIGLVSYSAYLWHQPLFAFVRAATLHTPSQLVFLGLIAITLGLAYLSWRFVENPVRNRKLFSRKMIFTGTAIVSILVLGLSFVVSRNSINESRTSLATGRHLIAMKEELKRNYGLSKTCRKFVGNNPDCINGSDPTVLLWGDSHAMHIAPWLKESATRVPFIQQTLSACAPILGQAYSSADYGIEQGLECIDQNDSVFAWLKTQPNIKTVILSSTWNTALGPQFNTMNRKKEIALNATIGINTLRSTITSIQKLGKKVVVVSPVPKNIENTGLCLQKASIFGIPLSSCNFDIGVNLQKDVDGYLINIEDLAGVVHLAKYMCVATTCKVSLGKTFIYRDAGHLSNAGSGALGKKFDLMGAAQKTAR